MWLWMAPSYGLVGRCISARRRYALQTHGRRPWILILRNARIPEASGVRPADIGIDRGRIVAIEPHLTAEGREIDVQGCLVAPGLVETHIHLDKSCILDRCKAEKGDLDEAISEVARAKKAFTPEDVYARGKRTLEQCILQRDHTHAHAARGGPGDRAPGPPGHPPAD